MITTVDKDILDFLKAIYFGDFSNPYKSASDRAYRDMNRTIRFEGLDSIVRLKLREITTDILSRNIDALHTSKMDKQVTFDNWHYNVCSEIRTLYRNSNVHLTYGQAQKWVNMTIKYLYILEVYSFNDIFGFLHIPLDNYIFDISRDSLGIERPHIAWSKWDDYEGQYLDYQIQIRNKVVGCEPLRWEFRYWLKAARNMEEE